MEPIFKNSQSPLQEAATSSTQEPSFINDEQSQGQGSTSPESRVNERAKSAAYTQNDDLNTQIIENLKQQRDQLRGTSIEEAGEKSKKNKLKIALALLIVLVLASVIYILITKNSTNQESDLASSAQSSQKAFKPPSDLKSKTSEEQNALTIISLARKNDTAGIVNTYLNKAKLGQSEADFAALINSYSTAADGESAELIEKKVGKVDFASTGESSAIAETTSEFDAASLIYKSGYFGRTNNIYLKINLYKPDPTADSWKMYIFEFKAGDSKSPLVAETHVPI